jgi:uncharacterized membrane protein
VPKATSVVAFISIALIIAVVIFGFSSIISLGGNHSNGVPFENNPGFLWTYRGIDTIAQIFIVIAAMVAISAIFREAEKKGASKGADEGPTEAPEDDAE